MVKLNLLEIPEDQQTGIREQDDLSEFSKATEDIDLSFFQQSNEPAEPTTINTSSPMFGDDDTGDQSDIFSAPVSDFTGDSITHDEPVNFDQDSGSARKWFWVVGGFLITALLAVGGWFLLEAFRSKPPVDSAIAQTNTENPQQPNANTPPEPPVSRIAPALASRYALNQATNQKNVALTKNLFSVKGQNGRSDYKMMVMAPDNLYLSIAGTNRDEIARLHQEIERAIPGLKLTAKNNLDQRLDGSQKLVVDYYVALNPPSQGAAGASFEEEDGDLAGALRRLAASSRIGGFSIKTGKQERDGNLTRTYYYIEGQGARSSVLSFIEGIAGEHPSVAFSKVSIFPPQSDRSMGSGALKTKITLLQYRLR